MKISLIKTSKLNRKFKCKKKKALIHLVVMVGHKKVKEEHLLIHFNYKEDYQISFNKMI